MPKKISAAKSMRAKPPRPRHASHNVGALRRRHEVPAALPGVDVWQVQVLRLTAFPEPIPNLQIEGWWQSLVGEQPETRNSQPRQGVVQESGPFLDGMLTLGVTPLRIDWLLSTKLDEVAPMTALPVLGCLSDAAQAFSANLNRWFQMAPAIKRLAFGCIAYQQVANKREAYELLDRYLPAIEMDAEGSSDFMFQINRPRPSSVMRHLNVNRLMKWSAARIQGVAMQLTIAPGGPESAISTVPVSDIHACRMELDINTEADRTKPFEPDELPRVFGELVGLSLEIASRGDIK